MGWNTQHSKYANSPYINIYIMQFLNKSYQYILVGISKIILNFLKNKEIK